jgi:hypothetical protein
MSATATKQSRRSDVVTGVPSLPQVNLLPPEVRAARGLVHIKRWLGLALVVVLVLVALGFVAALFAKGTADAELVDAQAETVRLQAEEAKYAEVPLVVNDLRRSSEARELGMATEVFWKSYLDAIAAVLPANVGIESFTIAQATPTTEAPAAPDAIAEQGIASISFASTAIGLPDNAAWLDALNSIPGFYAATASTETIGDDAGTIAYSVSSTVQVDESVFALRFPASGTDATAATEGN